MTDRGHIELERSLVSIVVGQRHRRDAGDLAPLMDSMQRVGLLQPVTITPDGFLICGYRRLEAAKRLGWTTLRVWVRSGISDDLTRLLAERDENLTHKPLSVLEAAHLYDELKTLLREDAVRRQEATRYGARPTASTGDDGGPDSGPPGTPGRIGRQAALIITQRASHTRLEQILEIERIAANRDLPTDLRVLADEELLAIRNGGPVDPSFQKVKAAQHLIEQMQESDDDADNAEADEALQRARADRARRIKENRARREARAALAKRSTRSFTFKWAELDGWSAKYDVDQIATELTADDWALFLRVVHETVAFADAVTMAREAVSTPA
ncbi:MAG: ParB N-terminal domain-containing protein [Microbacteriaceae bacterium]